MQLLEQPWAQPHYKTHRCPCTSVSHVHRSGQSPVAPVLCSNTLWPTLCAPVVVTVAPEIPAGGARLHGRCTSGQHCKPVKGCRLGSILDEKTAAFCQHKLSHAWMLGSWPVSICVPDTAASPSNNDSAVVVPAGGHIYIHCPAELRSVIQRQNAAAQH